MLSSRYILVIYFMYSSVYMSIPISQLIPPHFRPAPISLVSPLCMILRYISKCPQVVPWDWSTSWPLWTASLYNYCLYWCSLLPCCCLLGPHSQTYCSHIIRLCFGGTWVKTTSIHSLLCYLLTWVKLLNCSASVASAEKMGVIMSPEVCHTG